MSTVLKLGTRGSPLAMVQARHVAQLIQAQDPTCNVEIRPMVSEGDLNPTVPMAELGGGGGLY